MNFKFKEHFLFLLLHGGEKPHPSPKDVYKMGARAVGLFHRLAKMTLVPNLEGESDARSLSALLGPFKSNWM